MSGHHFRMLVIPLLYWYQKPLRLSSYDWYFIGKSATISTTSSKILGLIVMEQIGFRMQLNTGQAAEYRRRHDDIWPELVSLLKQAGISDYSIFLHDETNSLFAVLRRNSDHTMDSLPLEPIMQKWWAHMSDIMASDANHEPVVEPMERVFYLA